LTSSSRCDSVAVYDELGNKKASKTWYEGSELSLNVSPPLDQTRTYTAYVARDAPSPGPPRDTVRAVASLTFASGTLGDQTMEGVNLGLIPTVCTDEQIVLVRSSAPMATHTQGSTVSDQALIFQSGINAGLSKEKALMLAMAGLGSMAWWLVDGCDGIETPPPPAPSVTLPPPTPPVIKTPRPRSNPPTFEDELTEIYLRRASSTGAAISTVAAQLAAA
jgi:hypothetical protein